MHHRPYLLTAYGLQDDDACWLTEWHPTLEAARAAQGELEALGWRIEVRLVPDGPPTGRRALACGGRRGRRGRRQ